MTRNLQIMSGTCHKMFATYRFCGCISKTYDYLMTDNLISVMRYSNSGSIVYIVHMDWILHHKIVCPVQLESMHVYVHSILVNVMENGKCDLNYFFLMFCYEMGPTILNVVQNVTEYVWFSIIQFIMAALCLSHSKWPILVVMFILIICLMFIILYKYKGKQLIQMELI
jgi:hypothetical protein